MSRSQHRAWAVIGLAVVVALPVLEQDLGDLKPPDESRFHKKPGYSPYAGREFPGRPPWGDQHVHTGWSVDAGVAGATLSPEDAVRFARGEEVVSSTGQLVELSRPHDWIAVTDHSDGVGIIAEMRSGNAELLSDPTIEGPQGGATGAVVSLVAIFLPGCLLVAGTLPFWRALAARRDAVRALAGVNSAVVGLLAAALYDPVWRSAVLAPQDFAVALIGFVLLAATRASSLVVVAWCVAATMLAGGVIPCGFQPC